jgi:hypothetical protein
MVKVVFYELQNNLCGTVIGKRLPGVRVFVDFDDRRIRTSSAVKPGLAVVAAGLHGRAVVIPDSRQVFHYFGNQSNL